VIEPNTTIRHSRASQQGLAVYGHLSQLPFPIAVQLIVGEWRKEGGLAGNASSPVKQTKFILAHSFWSHDSMFSPLSLALYLSHSRTRSHAKDQSQVQHQHLSTDVGHVRLIPADPSILKFQNHPPPSISYRISKQ